MSDKNTFDVAALDAQLQKKAHLETKKEEVLEKELKVKERRLNNEIQKIEQADLATEIARSTNYGQMSAEEIAAIQKENTEYMLASRNKICFIHPNFDNAVPFFRKNLILVGGKTGEGKSTTVANIIRTAIRDVNPETGKLRRVLVLTNEERAADVYNRVTCLIKGWSYVNHDKFTDHQVGIFNEYMENLSRSGMVTVIDDTYNGAGGTTSTVEGICQVFDNLIEKKEHYDAVIIDYYQNISQSRVNPGLQGWQVQELLASKLDQYKNVYPAPIVLLAQVAPPDAEKKTPFKFRIEGRKSILNVATCCVEIIANREERTTEWHFHKSRFNEAVGDHLTTGYDGGRYVTYDEAFKAKVEEMKARQVRQEVDKQLKMPEIVELKVEELPKEEKKE